MASRNDIFDRARKHVERQMKLQQDEHRRAAMQKRIECVTNGVRFYRNKQLAEAAKSYKTYLHLLEDWKGVGDGGLMPSSFDATKELGDLLLLAGVYWDLVKLYDRTESEEKRQEFRHYLEKYILFSKGTSYQPLCAEGLRRYIMNAKPKHAEDFKNAYKILGDGKCFVVTSLMDVTDFETLPVLWRFRDEVLARSFSGRLFVRAYYRLGPSVAAAMDRCPTGLRRIAGSSVDRLARWINALRSA